VYVILITPLTWPASSGENSMVIFCVEFAAMVVEPSSDRKFMSVANSMFVIFSPVFDNSIVVLVSSSMIMFWRIRAGVNSKFCSTISSVVLIVSFVVSFMVSLIVSFVVSLISICAR